MYRLYDFGRMISDNVRMDAYINALDRSVQPGSVVVDIGTGTGIFALYASYLGARKVYALDPNDEIMVAKRLANSNGFSDRIDFYHDLSTRVNLPEKADLIVSDLRGVLPLVSKNIPSIIDARKRFLKDGGLLIPQKDRLFIALVNPKAAYDRIVGPWKTRRFKVDMKPALPAAVNNLQSIRLRPSQVLVDEVLWTEIDYTKVQNPNARGTVEFNIQEGQKCFGIGMWFDTNVFGDISYSTTPFGPSTVYGHMFFPFERPLHLSTRDRVVVTLAANYVGKEIIWRWQTKHYKQGSNRSSAAYDQSSFYGVPLIPEKMRKQSDQWVPCLNEEGLVTQSVLNLMGQGKNLSEIAEIIQKLFPGHFYSNTDALVRIKDLSYKYSL